MPTVLQFTNIAKEREMIYSFTRATVALRHSTGERGAQVTMGAIEYVLSVETHNVME